MSDKIKVFVLLRGASGVGKSSLANAITNYWRSKGQSVSGPHEADQWMINSAGEYEFNPKKLGYCHNQCFEACKRAFQDGFNIVIQSNTNIKKWEYQKYIDEAEKYGYKVQEIIIRAEFDNTHGVPREKVQQMKDNFEF